MWRMCKFEFRLAKGTSALISSLIFSLRLGVDLQTFSTVDMDGRQIFSRLSFYPAFISFNVGPRFSSFPFHKLKSQISPSAAVPGLKLPQFEFRFIFLFFSCLWIPLFFFFFFNLWSQQSFIQQPGVLWWRTFHTVWSADFILNFFSFLQLHLPCMEFPRLKVKSKLPLQANTTATVTGDQSHICDHLAATPHPSPTKDQTHILMETILGP